MTTLPLVDARARLSELVAEAQATHERYEITRNGRPVAVLVAADAELMRAVQEGLAPMAMS